MKTTKTILKFLYATVMFVLHLGYKALNELTSRWVALFKRSGRNGRIALGASTFIAGCIGLVMVTAPFIDSDTENGAEVSSLNNRTDPETQEGNLLNPTDEPSVGSAQESTQADEPNPTATRDSTKTATPDSLATVRAQQESFAATGTAIRLSETPTEVPTEAPTETPKPTSIPQPIAIIKSSSVNMRSGPGTGYSVLSSGLQGEEYEIIASNTNGDWYNIILSDGSTAWLAASVIDVGNSDQIIQIAQTIPAVPVVAATSTPLAAENTPTPETSGMCESDMYTCSDLPGSRAQEVYNMCMPISGDIHRLDENNNGIACEDGADFNVAPLAPTQPPAPAPSNVVIVRVDKGAEFVDIQNTGGSIQDLNGWNLISEKGNQECRLSGQIAAGQTIRVYALASDGGLGGINCGHGKNIWNNSESDPAVLYNASGQEVSRR